jgi:hypothetical protein
MSLCFIGVCADNGVARGFSDGVFSLSWGLNRLLYDRAPPGSYWKLAGGCAQFVRFSLSVYRYKQQKKAELHAASRSVNKGSTEAAHGLLCMNPSKGVLVKLANG